MKHLGRVSNKPTRKLDLIPLPQHKAHVRVTLHCAEFTSLCPVTKQPDFAELDVEYVPATQLVETKSWKLYLWSFREEPAFNEDICGRIADDFAEQVRPVLVKVTMRFHARGGIAVEVSAERRAVL